MNAEQLREVRSVVGLPMTHKEARRIAVLVRRVRHIESRAYGSYDRAEASAIRWALGVVIGVDAVDAILPRKGAAAMTNPAITAAEVQGGERDDDARLRDIRARAAERWSSLMLPPEALVDAVDFLLARVGALTAERDEWTPDARFASVEGEIDRACFTLGAQVTDGGTEGLEAAAVRVVRERDEALAEVERLRAEQRARSCAACRGTGILAEADQCSGEVRCPLCPLGKEER